MNKKICLLMLIFCVFVLTSCEDNSSSKPVNDENTYTKEDSIEEINTKEIDEPIETPTNQNSDNIIKEREYQGRIGNSDIQMSLNYYDDGTVSGSYFYDKFKTDILIYGTYEYNKITLYSDELEETFDGYINGTFISGDWKNPDNSENFVIWNENFDDYEKSLATMQIDNKYLYYKKIMIFINMIIIQKT